MDNDLVLEQYLSPASPMIAGFRLEAFGAIKPRVTHSPSSGAQIWDASVTFLEDRHIYPAVLYLQVSIVQVIRIQSINCFPWTTILHRRILFSHFQAWFVSLSHHKQIFHSVVVFL